MEAAEAGARGAGGGRGREEGRAGDLERVGQRLGARAENTAGDRLEGARRAFPGRSADAIALSNESPPLPDGVGSHPDDVQRVAQRGGEEDAQARAQDDAGELECVWEGQHARSYGRVR